MFPDIIKLEASIVQRLEPIKASRKITPRAFPDDLENEGVPISGMGICLVAFQSANGTQPTNLQFGNQPQTITLAFELVLIQRGGKSHKLNYPTIQQIVDLLAGQKLIDEPGYGKLYFNSVAYSGLTQEEKCWIYTISFSMPYTMVSGDCCD